MTPTQVVEAVAAAGGTLTVEGGRLRCRAPRGALTPELLAALRTHKSELIAIVGTETDAQGLERPGGGHSGSCGDPLPRPPAGRFAPLDSELAAGEASKWAREEIVVRLTRLEARAGSPDASPVDRQLVADWRAVLSSKDSGTMDPTETCDDR